MSFRPNLLVDPLPTTVEIAGDHVPIRTSFRIGILFEIMITSGEFDDQEAKRQALILWYPEESLEHIGKTGDGVGALKRLLWFYRGGKPDQKREDGGNGGLSRRVYDFDEDAERIYAAFLSQYRIDLTEVDLHWWKFSALFSGLHEDEEIMRIMSYRACDLTKIKNREERTRLNKLQTMYALPDHRSAEEKAAAIGSAFGVF